MQVGLWRKNSIVTSVQNIEFFFYISLIFSTLWGWDYSNITASQYFSYATYLGRAIGSFIFRSRPRASFTYATLVRTKLHYTDTGYGHVQHHQWTSPTVELVTKPLARLLEPLRIATILNIYLSNGM